MSVSSLPCCPAVRNLAGFAAQAGDPLESRLFIGRVLFYRLDEFGNQVVTTFQLHFDIGPTGPAALAVNDQAIINQDEVSGRCKRCCQGYPFNHWK